MSSCTALHSPYLVCSASCVNASNLIAAEQAIEEAKSKMSACNCSSCQSYELKVQKVQNVPTLLPGGDCTLHSSTLGYGCQTCSAGMIIRFAALMTYIPAADLLDSLQGYGRNSLEMGLRNLKGNLEWKGAYAGSVAEAVFEAIYEDWDRTSAKFSYDLHCATCDVYVTPFLSSDKAHWDMVCGDCGQHEEDHSICPECESCNESGPCSCCSDCGQYLCSCCEYCGYAPDGCECTFCEDCDVPVENCGCGSEPYRFGETREVPWLSGGEGYGPVETPLRKMSALDQTIDPVRAAADFYLLDAIVNLVRFGQVQGSEDALGRLHASKARLVESDDMLSALTISARKSYQALVERLDREFLTYALSAVGGELRYHRACSGGPLYESRSASWAKFVDIVQENGPKVLFDADVLFREFGSGGYGGELWGNAAKIVGQRLSGKMPSWLFVDRMFTLEHNGGCFLNKVEWTTSNGLNYSLYHMRRVLDAHASSDPDWDLLVRVASPGVAEMFRLADRRVAVAVRRFGAELAPIRRTKAKKYDSGRPCPDCGYYSCCCSNAF